MVKNKLQLVHIFTLNGYKYYYRNKINNSAEYFKKRRSYSQIRSGEFVEALKQYLDKINETNSLKNNNEK